LGRRGRSRRVLAGAVAVADCIGAEGGRFVDGRAEVRDVGARRLHEEDVTARADRADHVEVERDLAGPPRIGRRIVRAARLVDLLEAPVGRGACGEVELAPVGREIALGVRVVLGVDDRDRHAGAPRRREVVGALEIGRKEAALRRRGRRLVAARVRTNVGQTPRERLARGASAVGDDGIRRCRAERARVVLAYLLGPAVAGAARDEYGRHGQNGKHCGSKTHGHPPSNRPFARPGTSSASARRVLRRLRVST
jgi:hypothetical protein